MYYDSMAGNLGGDVSHYKFFINIKMSDWAKTQLKLFL